MVEMWYIVGRSLTEERNMKYDTFEFAVFIIIVLGVGFFLVELIQPNDVYVTEGIITKIQTDSKILSEKCEPKQGKNGKMVRITDCVQKKPKIIKSTSGYEIVYCDQKGIVRVNFTHNAKKAWVGGAINYLPKKLHKHGKKIYTTSGTTHIGCKVDVYYKIGSWFGDRSWNDPVFDASMCGPQKAERSAK